MQSYIKEEPKQWAQTSDFERKNFTVIFVKELNVKMLYLFYSGSKNSPFRRILVININYLDNFIKRSLRQRKSFLGFVGISLFVKITATSTSGNSSCFVSFVNPNPIFSL